MKNLEEEFRHFQAHSGSVESLDNLVQTGNTDGYLQRMQAIRSQAKKCKHEHLFDDENSSNDPLMQPSPATHNNFF